MSWGRVGYVGGKGSCAESGVIVPPFMTFYFFVAISFVVRSVGGTTPGWGGDDDLKPR